MKWKILNENNQSTTINSNTLLEFLTGKVLVEDREDFIAVAATFSNYLQAKGTLGQFNSDQLITTSLALGYFYRVFLEKNNIEIIGEKKNELANTNNNEHTNENSSE